MKTLYFIAGFLCCSFLFTCNGLTSIMQGSSELKDTSWMNNAGDIVSSLIGDPEAFAVYKKDIIDSLAAVYNTKPKKIIEYVVVETKTEAEIKPDGPSAADYFPVDSTKDCPPAVKNIRQNFSSPYYSAQVQIGDSSYMKLQAYDTATIVWKHISKGNIFNRRSAIQLDVSMANPNVKVTVKEAYRIYEKPKKWGVGIQLGYGFSNTIKPSPYLGIGINYSIIKF